MTTTTSQVSERTLLAQLARVHAWRYARHPLFLIGLALAMAATTWDIVDDPNLDSSRDGGLNFYSAFLIGVLGLIVSHRLTRTEGKAVALLPSTPVSQTTRTLALCAACLVPALAAALVLTVAMLGWLIFPPSYLQVWVDAMPTADFVAWAVGSTVIAGLGGPLLGVAVGRWWGFPGAGAAAAVLTVVAAGAGTMVAMTASFAASRAGLVGPWIVWLELPDIVDVSNAVLVRGSAVGHLVYTIGLCGLAVWAAVIRDAEGAARSVWMRRGAIAMVVAVGGLLWAILG